MILNSDTREFLFRSVKYILNCQFCVRRVHILIIAKSRRMQGFNILVENCMYMQSPNGRVVFLVEQFPRHVRSYMKQNHPRDGNADVPQQTAVEASGERYGVLRVMVKPPE